MCAITTDYSIVREILFKQSTGAYQRERILGILSFVMRERILGILSFVMIQERRESLNTFTVCIFEFCLCFNNVTHS